MKPFLEIGQFAYQPEDKIPDWYFRHLLADALPDVKFKDLSQEQIETCRSRSGYDETVAKKAAPQPVAKVKTPAKKGKDGDVATTETIAGVELVRTDGSPEVTPVTPVGPPAPVTDPLTPPAPPSAPKPPRAPRAPRALKKKK